MAREIRDDDVIGKSGVYLNESCNKLITLKNSFMNHVNNFKINYEGIDATAIYNVLVNAINRVDELVETLNYYSEYMLSVAKYDNENIENATKKIKSKNTLQPATPPEDIFLTDVEGESVNEPEQVKY